MRTGKSNKGMVAVALLTAALSAGCAGAGGFTTGPSLGWQPGTNTGTNDNTSNNVDDGATTVGGGGGGDTDLNIPGGGGNTNQQGSAFVPQISVPAQEGFVDNSGRSDDDVEAWLKNLVETLPNARTSGSSVFQNDSLQNWAYAVYNAVNAKRRAAGLQELEYEPHLEVLAQAHARDMALRNFFSHDCPDGVLMWDRWQAIKVPFCNWAGENAAMGQETAQEVVDQWMASPGHKKIMMHPSAEYCGVGVYFDSADSSMPVKVIMEYAEFRDDPASHDWYERGDIYNQ